MRAADNERMAAVLRERGITVEEEPGGALLALATPPEVVGQAAADQQLALVELGAVSRSLEDVFFELTQDEA